MCVITSTFTAWQLNVFQGFWNSAVVLKASRPRRGRAASEVWKLQAFWVCSWIQQNSNCSVLHDVCVTRTKISTSRRESSITWSLFLLNRLLSVTTYCLLMICSQSSEKDAFHRKNRLTATSTGLPHWERLLSSRGCPAGVETQQKEVETFSCCRQKHEEDKHTQQQRAGREICTNASSVLLDSFK